MQEKHACPSGAKQRRVHFIGICGVAMSALAVLWYKKGFKVTGSDKGFYPPISTHLQKYDIKFYPGWHVGKMGEPDLVVVGNVAGSENPELKYVLENNIPHFTYPELIQKYLLKENSIVCAGTYGKTSTTALLAWILKQAKYKPSYMFGALAGNFKMSAGDLGGKWSVLEGDEYKISREDVRAKFFLYNPTHLLLTGLKWDHADVYPTSESYLDAFSKLLASIPESGLIVACRDDKKVLELTKNSKTNLIYYGKDENSKYVFNNIISSKNGLEFEIEVNNKKHKISAPHLIGEYMAENICGAFAMAVEIGIKPKRIVKAIKKFKGIKRRLEKRGTINGADVYDDIAHSPAKAKSTITNLRKIYQGKIYAIFEPNTGNRQVEIISEYDNAFNLADEVIIPRLTKIKQDKTKPQAINGEGLQKIIQKTHGAVSYFEDDEKLINYIKEKTQAGDVVVFLGSHGFRNMIETVAGV